MSYFVSEEKVRVDFPDGEWVEIKKDMTQADDDYVIDHEHERGLATLERRIVAWSFKEPLSRENISRLRMPCRLALFRKFIELDKGSSDFLKN